MPAPAATYLSHWGLRHSPFRARSASDGFHASPTHEEALARLHFLVEHRRQFGLLLGEIGVGKTLLLSRFAEELREQGIEAAPVALYSAGANEFLRTIAGALGLFPRGDEPLHSLWAMIVDRLVERRCQQLTTVLLLDDADRAGEDALAAVVRLLQIDASPEARLIVVAAAETHRLARLGARLIDLAELRVDLEPWSLEETFDYVRQSLVHAGRDEPLFDDGAVVRVHELSRGRPRRVAQIADLALLAAAGQEQPTIDAETVESVVRELTVPLSTAS